jgi:ankyrin repeat protein
MTPLISVAENGTPDVLKELIEAGAKVNAKNKAGRNALMAAVQYGLLANIKLLLDAGADVNAKDKEGETALKMAKDLLAGTIDADANSNESPKSKEAGERKDSKEVEELRKLVALLISYGAIE